jgi:serine/threonine protein kinase
LDVWAFGVIIANMCSNAYITESLSEEGALNDLWEKFGYPSQEQWPCPRPPWNGTKKGLKIHSSHSAILDVLRGSLQTNPEKRLSAQELLDLPFWNEIPDSKDSSEAREFMSNAYKKFTISPRIDARYSYTNDQFTQVNISEKIYRESDELWLKNCLNFFTEDHAKAIKIISTNCEWPKEALDLCILILDKSLNGGVFNFSNPESLACSSAFITACLYSNDEPSLDDLIKWTGCKDTKKIVESGIHTVMTAMKFRLLPKDICDQIRRSKNWEKVLSWIN